MNSLTPLTLMPTESWEPLIILNLLNLPLGWAYRPPLEALQVIHVVGMAAGVLALVGFLTNLSLLIFAGACVYLTAFGYSFGDFHHPEAVMMIALAALAVSPSGRAVSVDSVIRRRFPRSTGARHEGWLDGESPFAGWPIKLIQWFFVLMYASAVWSKLSFAGLDWPNGYTLQYYLVMDGLRWDSPLALWLSQHHLLVHFGQYMVLLFQATFALAVVFPKLRWIYVPAGLGLHLTIYLTLKAPFFTWMILYAVFIPWSEVVKLLRGWLARHAPAAVK